MTVACRSSHLWLMFPKLEATDHQIYPGLRMTRKVITMLFGPHFEHSKVCHNYIIQSFALGEQQHNGSINDTTVFVRLQSLFFCFTLTYF